MYVDQSELYTALITLDVDSLSKMQAAMSGHDDDSGELEGLAKGLDRAHEVIAKLVFLLIKKQLLSKEEATDIIAEYSFDKYLVKSKL